MGRVTVRLPDKLHRSLRSASARTGESMNEMIVQAVSTALEEPAEKVKTPLEKEIARVRRALGDMVVDVDFDWLPEHLRPTADLPDTDTLRESMPRLIPPLSAAIIEDREDRF